MHAPEIIDRVEGRRRRPGAVRGSRLRAGAHGWCVTVAIVVVLMRAAAGDPPPDGTDAPPVPSRRSQQELMSERGFVRYEGAWRTVQEIELIDRARRANTARKEWVVRLERLRRQCQPQGDRADVRKGTADRAADEIRGIADPFAVPALAAAVAKEESFRVRRLCVEALSRIRSAEATAALAAIAVDHADPETRIAAVERLVAIGPHAAVPPIVAALGSADNDRVNRAAEALGRLGVPTVVAPLIEALETEHLAVTGDGAPEGSTTATFTPAGGGLAMGGGAKRVKVTRRNERVLESLVALTGVNFEWNAAAWRAWLANRQSPPDFDPRRG